MIMIMQGAMNSSGVVMLLIKVCNMYDIYTGLEGFSTMYGKLDAVNQLPSLGV